MKGLAAQRRIILKKKKSITQTSMVVKMTNKNIQKRNGFGFLSKDDNFCMIRCFECGKENYAMAVMSGCCAWCGYDANQVEVEK